MNNKKELPNVKLQKTSVIFMQLGLILAMFIVYLILEHESFYKPVAIVTTESIDDPDDNLVKVFKIEKTKQKKSSTEKKTEVEPRKKQQKVSSTFKTTTNEKEEDLSVILKPEDDDKSTKITENDIDEIVEVEEPDEVFPFFSIEYAPEYPGCKGSKAAKKMCFNNRIHKLVQRKFNGNLAQELGLSAGKQKIAVQFVINKEGSIVDIKIRAPHKRLEKEARRVVNLLPKMKPARQGKNFVNVRFNLPIVFNVED